MLVALSIDSMAVIAAFGLRRPAKRDGAFRDWFAKALSPLRLASAVQNALRLLAVLLLAIASSVAAAETNGFAVTFTAADNKTSDQMVLPNLWLYVEAGKPPTPFLAPGKFTAVF